MNPSYGYGIVPPPTAGIPPPQLDNFVYEIPVSPHHSPQGSRGTSRTRRGTTGEKSAYISYGEGEKEYFLADHLSPRGTALTRSSSVGGYRGGGRMEVSDSRSGRPRSTYYDHRRRDSREDEYRGRGKFYHNGGYPESTYSSSSRGSREHSRGPPFLRRRSPSCHSCDGGYEYPHSPHLPYPTAHTHPTHWPPVITGGMAPAPPPPPAPAGAVMQGAMTLYKPGQVGPLAPQQDFKNNPDLEQKILQLQKQLEESKLESEKIRKLKEAQQAAADREAEIAKQVQLLMDKRSAQEQAARAAAEAQKKAIEEEARKLLEKQKQQEEEKKMKEAELKRLIELEAVRKVAEEQKVKEAAAAKAKAEKERLEAEVAKRLAEEKEKVSKAEAAKKEKEAAEKKLREEIEKAVMKPTFTKFSKAHLCKEALDERKITYTEQDDSFLVHRWVDRDEQQALWNRTKEIRAYQLEYQKQFKAAADKAPIVHGPNGPVKIVRVGNHPPVTVPVVMVTKKSNKHR